MKASETWAAMQARMAQQKDQPSSKGIPLRTYQANLQQMMAARAAVTHDSWAEAKGQKGMGMGMMQNGNGMGMGGGMGMGMGMGGGMGMMMEEFPSTDLYVKGLPADATAESVKEIFANYGHVKLVKMLVMNAVVRGTMPESIALIEMESVEDATWICQKVHGNIPNNMDQVVHISYARTGKRQPMMQQGMQGPGNRPSQALVDPNSTHVYIKGLPVDVDDEWVARTFTPMGTVEVARVVRTGDGTCSGLGFVRFQDAASAVEAAKKMMGMPVKDGAGKLYVALYPDCKFQMQPPQAPELQKELLKIRQLELQRAMGANLPMQQRMMMQQMVGRQQQRFMPDRRPPRRPMGQDPLAPSTSTALALPSGEQKLEEAQAQAQAQAQPAGQLGVVQVGVAQALAQRGLLPGVGGVDVAAPFSAAQPPPPMLPPPAAGLAGQPQDAAALVHQQYLHQVILHQQAQHHQALQQHYLHQVLLQQQQAQAAAAAQAQAAAAAIAAQAQAQAAAAAQAQAQAQQQQDPQQQQQQQAAQGAQAEQAQAAQQPQAEGAQAEQAAEPPVPLTTYQQLMQEQARQAQQVQQQQQQQAVEASASTAAPAIAAATEGAAPAADAGASAAEQQAAQAAAATAQAAAAATAAAAAPGDAEGGNKRLREDGKEEEPAAKKSASMPTKAAEWVERQEEFFPGAPKLPEGWVRAKARSSGKTYYLRVKDTFTTYNLNEVYRDAEKKAE